MTVDYYDKEGNPMTTAEWVNAFEDREFKQVALTTIGPYRVSTVWLGLDHRFSGNGPPLIFETMTFTDDNDNLGNRVWRYSTITKARMGHKAACRLIKAINDR